MTLTGDILFNFVQCFYKLPIYWYSIYFFLMFVYLICVYSHKIKDNNH